MDLGRIMGIVPAGIGVSALGFAWMNPSMPLFFRLFFSFIALGFVIVGFTLVSGRATDPQRIARMAEQMRERLGTPSTPSPGSTDGQHVSYTCANCGAGLNRNTDVSPHGDVKCRHCDRWFNVHGHSAKA